MLFMWVSGFSYCYISSLNYFVVVDLCIGIWFLQTPPVLGFTLEINDTVLAKNGTKAVNLSCGEVPQNTFAIEWFMYKNNQMKKILKFYMTINGTTSRFYNNYPADKYGISASEKTSLVIKNIELRDIDCYVCVAIWGGGYVYTTMLEVEGKLLFNVQTLD